MKNSYLFKLIVLLLFSCCFLTQCAKDKLDETVQDCVVEVSYDNGARTVLDNTCAYSGCHDGFNSPGDFRTYGAMKSYLNESDFEQRVINLRDMPPVYASGPKTLTAEQILTLQCWIENEYKEE